MDTVPHLMMYYFRICFYEAKRLCYIQTGFLWEGIEMVPNHFSNFSIYPVEDIPLLTVLRYFIQEGEKSYEKCYLVHI